MIVYYCAWVINYSKLLLYYKWLGRFHSRSIYSLIVAWPLTFYFAIYLVFNILINVWSFRVVRSLFSLNELVSLFLWLSLLLSRHRCHLAFYSYHLCTILIGILLLWNSLSIFYWLLLFSYFHIIIAWGNLSQVKVYSARL